MTALPAGWSTATLGGVALEVRNGISTKPSQDSGVPILRISSVRPMKLDASDVRYLPANFQGADTYALRADDLLFTRYNGNRELVGACARVGAVSGTLTYPDKLIRVRLDSRIALPAFVEAAACAQSARNFIDQQLKTSAGQVGISGADLKRMPLSLAPLAEQQRIADKLDAVVARVDACRDRLARVTPLLKRFRQSVLAAASSGRLTEDWRTTSQDADASQELNEWVAQRATKERKPPVGPDLSHWVGVLPKGWAIASVNQFAECLDRLRVPIRRDDRENAKGLYPYYGANGEVSRIDEFIFDDELVLVTEDETFYGREKPIAYRVSGKCWVNNHAHVLRARSQVANDYLCFALMHYNVLPWLTGTTGRAKLTQQALNSLPIGVPPSKEIEEIVRRVEILFAFADRLEARLAKALAAADRLTPSLLAKAFRGELVPQDPADEPAAVLLQRLAASRPAPAAKVRRPRAGQVG
jgi:type I restriction enzyme S subunit